MATLRAEQGTMLVAHLADKTSPFLVRFRALSLNETYVSRIMLPEQSTKYCIFTVIRLYDSE